MFNWFQKKHNPNGALQAKALLALPDDAFAAFVEATVREDQPASRAMFVVAYDNLRPLSGAMYSSSMKTEGKPFLVENFVFLFLEALERHKDEVNQRRFTWFLMAALIGRLDKLARQNAALRAPAVSCWVMLAESAPFLRRLLPHNVVWKDDEKVWFERLETEADYVKHVLSQTMPASYESDPLIEGLARKYDIFLWPRQNDLFCIV